MLRSGTNGLILVVEGTDDRHVIERHVHDSVVILCGQGGKRELLEAAVSVDKRLIANVRIIVDRDYDDEITQPQPYADCIVPSSNHDLIMDLVLADRPVMHRVIGAHIRGTTASSPSLADQLISEAFLVAAKVSMLRMLSVENGWELTMAGFPFGRFEEMRPNAENVVRLALGRSKPGPKRTPVLRTLRSALKRSPESLVKLVGDHDFFGALAYILRNRGMAVVKETVLATSFFAAVDCPSMMKTDWHAEITTWSRDNANLPSFTCPCDYAA